MPAYAARTATPRPVSLSVLPAKIVLNGPRDEARYIVRARFADGSERDVTRAAAASANDCIQVMEPGRLLPKKAGQTHLKVMYGGVTATAPVSVGKLEESRVSFLNEVEPILTRAGCNQGSCHGSQFGKGGFKLSLAGYDPDFDHLSLTRLAGGRRANLAEPQKSLLLRKPALDLAHQGGLKLARTSADYRTVLLWLEQGAAGPNPRDPDVTALRVYPARRMLTPGESQRLVILADYTDGSVRDVTAHTRMNAIDESVAKADSDGTIIAKGRGATAVMLRYGGKVAVAEVATPYAQKAPASTFQPSGFVDRMVAARWDEMGLAPSSPCTDTEFIRRASLDVVGTLPTPEEVRAFQADPDTNKREKLIDRLLDCPEYVDYWALKWGDLLRNSRATLGGKAMWSLHGWLRESLAENRPFDQMARELLTAQGSTATNGPANFYRVASTPQDLTETTAQLFLGVRIQCAKCHHHPFEKWSQEDYYRFAAFFARVGVKPSGSDAIVRPASAGEVQHPKSGARMLPRPLAPDSGPRVPFATGVENAADRRLALAEWVTSRDNALFARTVVNRYWGHLMGRGLAHPVDDMRVTNPPSIPELLEAFSKEFVRNGYDLKRLIRTICTSKVYQLSSRPTRGNRDDAVFYSHYIPRRQPAEVMLDSIDAATGSPEKFPDLPLGTRAIQLPDATVASPFLDTFGRPARSTACECERTAEPSLIQALQLLSGESLNKKLSQPGGRVAALLEREKSDVRVIEELYYASLSRPPSKKERETAQAAFTRALTRKQAAEDLLWALLNTKEFAEIR